MEKLIACCGLNCATCDARNATVRNDDELRKATAIRWQADYSNPDLTWEMINCTGCREEGPKFSHCNLCEIRKCVHARGYDTCGDCAEMETCTLVAGIHKYVPEAVSNLRNI